MKLLFFLLLLINIVYFLWQYQREPLKDDAVITNQTEVQIQLLSEIPEIERIQKQETRDITVIKNPKNSNI